MNCRYRLAVGVWTASRRAPSAPLTTTTTTTTTTWYRDNALLLGRRLLRFQSTSSDEETEQRIRERALALGGNIDDGSGTRKTRGGKQARKRAAKFKSQEEDESVLAGGGHFPALRYSEEETQALLAEAYGGLPKRAGKRGTRNLKRQAARWKEKRRYDEQRKEERIRAHEKRHRRQHEISVEIRAVKNDAEKVRKLDENYQVDVLQKYIAMINLTTVDQDEERQEEFDSIETKAA